MVSAGLCLSSPLSVQAYSRIYILNMKEICIVIALLVILSESFPLPQLQEANVKRGESKTNIRLSYPGNNKNVDESVTWPGGGVREQLNPTADKLISEPITSPAPSIPKVQTTSFTPSVHQPPLLLTPQSQRSVHAPRTKALRNKHYRKRKNLRVTDDGKTKHEHAVSMNTAPPRKKGQIIQAVALTDQFSNMAKPHVPSPYQHSSKANHRKKMTRFSGKFSTKERVYRGRKVQKIRTSKMVKERRRTQQKDRQLGESNKDRHKRYMYGGEYDFDYGDYYSDYEETAKTDVERFLDDWHQEGTKIVGYLCVFTCVFLTCCCAFRAACVAWCNSCAANCRDCGDKLRCRDPTYRKFCKAAAPFGMKISYKHYKKLKKDYMKYVKENHIQEAPKI